MANAVNSGFAKCFIFFMAIVILVQGAVYLGLSIWGFILRECAQEATDIAANPFKFVIDLIYFADENCGNPKVSIDIPGQGMTNGDLQVDWPVSRNITNRFYIFLITYTVISALWVVTSFLVLATMCGRLTKVVSAVIYWPWFLVVIAGSILDAVATGFFIKDIVNTTSADETFKYIGVTADENTMNVLRTFDPYFVTPSIIMTCIASRVVIIWLLNIFGCSFCLSMSTLLAKSNSKSKSKNRATVATTAQSPNYYGDNLAQQQQQQQQQQQPQMQERKYEQTPRQLSYIEPARSPTPLQQQQQQQMPPTPLQKQQSQIAAENIIVEAQVIGSAPLADDMMAAKNTTYRPTEAHPDKLDYPRSSTPEIRVRTPQPQLAVESPLNTRYSDAFQLQQPAQQQRVSEELRGQLPWSYTSILAKPQVPRKPQVYPEIPEADYNNDADGVVQSNNDGTAYSRW